MQRAALAHPVVSDRTIKGQKGINVIEQYLLEMGHWWEPPGPIDAGIDGRIQLRDARTGEPLNRSIGVQSKGWDKFTGETDDSFEFTCRAAHIHYWRRAREPVLLICSHPTTREAWFKCVNEWFADPARRRDRKVLFDKAKDRFDASRAPDLLRLASPDEPTVIRQPLAPPEQQITNLLEIVEHPMSIWSAPTTHDASSARDAFAAANNGRVADYIIRDGHVHSLREPATTALRHICDADNARCADLEEWTHSDRADLRRWWTELLRRSLLEQTKARLRWDNERHLFFFRAFGERSHRIRGANGKNREIVTVRRYRDKGSGEHRTAWVRHHAFGVDFVEVDGRWCAALQPDYVFTSDGEVPHRRPEEPLAKIKAIEKQAAVYGHLKMWEHVLAEQAALIGPQPILRFGSLVSVEVPIGLDDSQWGYAESDEDPFTGVDAA